MKRFFFLACVTLIAASMQAQETYESAELATEDLNGTARYIGMGGAMEALGADISTISTNPAGIGLFRRSWVGASAGLTIQRGDSYNNSVYSDKGKTNADFNQMGAVFAMQTGNNSFFNFGFNYHKRRNFNQISTLWVLWVIPASVRKQYWLCVPIPGNAMTWTISFTTITVIMALSTCPTAHSSTA